MELNLSKTSIIIPTYDNLVCLRQCLDSIRSCTKELYDIIVVDNGSNLDVMTYLEEQKDIVYIRTARKTFAQACNIGLTFAKGDFVCFLNDDTIVSKNWLKYLVETAGITGCSGPLSNCDKGWYHNFNLFIKGISLEPGIHKPGFLEPVEIYNFESPVKQIVERPWIAFYCTVVRRDVLDKVGLLDEKFSNSGEDADYCVRINKAGYRCFQDYRSFVFHYGAVTRKNVEKEEFKDYHEKDEANKVIMKKKFTSKLVVLYSGPAFERWDYKNLDTDGIGGSESQQIYLSRELAKAGYKVVNFCDCEQESFDGSVEYKHFSKFEDFCKYDFIDVLILERTTAPLVFNMNVGKVLVMIHDVFLGRESEIPFVEKVDKFIVLSDWHRDFVTKHHNLPLEKISIVSNGLDFNLYKKEVVREPYRLHWSSSLDRGLDNLLYLFDFIKANIPELTLHIYYGTKNWELVAQKNFEQLKKLNEIKHLMNKPGVVYHGRVNKQELAIAELSSSLWVYPTTFSETFCITAIEAQAAGMPVICSNYAGLQTTVGSSGILVGNGSKSAALTKDYRIEFAEKTIEILKNKELWNKYSKMGLENAAKYTWEVVAQQFIALFNK